MAPSRWHIKLVSKDYYNSSEASLGPAKDNRQTPTDHVGEAWFSDLVALRWNKILAPQVNAAADASAHHSHTLEMVPLSEFPNKALALFDRLDTDKNGSLSTAELSAAMQDNSITGEDAQTLAALYYSRNQLTNPQTGLIQKAISELCKMWNRLWRVLIPGRQQKTMPFSPTRSTPSKVLRLKQLNRASVAIVISKRLLQQWPTNIQKSF